MNAKDINQACGVYATNEELDWLAVWAANHKAYQRPFVVMIGAGPGVMAISLLEANPNIDLFVVDNDTFQWFDTYLKQADCNLSRVWRGLGDSSSFGEQWYGIMINLLIVDGDHSYAGVQMDMAAWLPFVAPGGYVLFHDYGENLHQQPTGVKQAVEEYLPPDYEDVAYIGISRIVRRK